MERFVAWLVELSPLTIYLVIGLLVFVENAFPPIPSDVAVAVGGFLTQHSGVSPTAVWLIGWLGNFAGAVAVYLVAGRYGRRFMASPLGQRLLPGDAIVSMEREYLRFGMAGVFFARLLPGFRSFIAPFVGLVGLPPIRALAPIFLASGLWYGFLTWIGVRLGAEWEAISRFLGHLNRTLAIVAIVVAIAVAFYFWRRSRAQGPRRRRLLRLIDTALGEVSEPPADGIGPDQATEAAAALLHELTHADPAFTLEERGAIAGYLRERWGLGALPRPSGTQAFPIPADTQELTSVVAENFDRTRRLALAERLYRISLSDGTLSQHEERLMLRVGDLLGLGPAELVEARKRAAS
jgi:membrane protein DedA with SNARE-associated domain